VLVIDSDRVLQVVAAGSEFIGAVDDASVRLRAVDYVLRRFETVRRLHHVEVGLGARDLVLERLGGVARICRGEHVFCLHPRDETCVARQALVPDFVGRPVDPRFAVLGSHARHDHALRRLLAGVDCVAAVELRPRVVLPDHFADFLPRYRSLAESMLRPPIALTGRVAGELTLVGDVARIPRNVCTTVSHDFSF